MQKRHHLAWDLVSYGAVVGGLICLLRPGREAKVVTQAAELGSRYLKTRIADERFLRGAISETEYRRQLDEIWPVS